MNDTEEFEKNMNLKDILGELSILPKYLSKKQMPFEKMEAVQLLNYISIHHHYYIKEVLPLIHDHLQKVTKKHEVQFPYMTSVFVIFKVFMKDMIIQMEKQKKVLFPRIAEDDYLVKEGKSSESLSAYFQKILNVAEKENNTDGNRMHQIRLLTNQYKTPKGGCRLFKKVLQELKELESDLLIYVYLEKNILFPKALKLELISHPEFHGLKF